MTPQPPTQSELNAAIQQLKRIADSLEHLTSVAHVLAIGVPAPGYKRRLNEFKNFNWISIGAKVITHDQHGPSAIEWNNHRFTRRSASDKKKGQAIWFSRSTGRRGENGEPEFDVLVKFKDYSEAEELPGAIALE